MLDKLLKKIGAKSFLDLNEAERETYKMWETALSGRRLTDEDVKVFLNLEKEDTENKLITTELGSRADIFYKMKLEFLKKLQNFLNSPIIEKEIALKALEREIESK